MKSFKCGFAIATFVFAATHASAFILDGATASDVSKEKTLNMECRIDTNPNVSSEPREIVLKSGKTFAVNCQDWSSCKNKNLNIEMYFDHASDSVLLEVADSQRNIGFQTEFFKVSETGINQVYASIKDLRPLLQIDCDIKQHLDK